MTATDNRHTRTPDPVVEWRAGNLERSAGRCVYVTLTFAVLCYLGAVALIVAGALDMGAAVVLLGMGIALGVTVSLAPVIMLCRWAQAYAADLESRNRGES